jgi:hypothetical protein
MNDRRGHRSVPVAAPFPLAAGLFAALLAACGTTTPTVVPTATTVPTSAPLTAAPVTSEPATEAPTTVPATIAPTTAAGAPACTAADLKASHGLVEGAAGSRLTEVVLVTAVPCSIDATPTLGIRDAAGAAIVGGVATGAGRIDLSPELSYSSNVRFANWCNPEPEFPLELTIRLGGEELPVSGGSFPDEESGMPPCNGESVAPTLEGDAWVPGAA